MNQQRTFKLTELEHIGDWLHTNSDQIPLAGLAYTLETIWNQFSSI